LRIGLRKTELPPRGRRRLPAILCTEHPPRFTHRHRLLCPVFVKKNWDNCRAARRELLKNSSGVVFRSQNGRQRAAPESGPNEMKARPGNPDDARETTKPRACRGFQGVIQPPRDQGALDTPILFQRTNQARRGSLKRPYPPRLSHDGPGLATTPAATGAMTEAILQKMQRLASVSGFVIGTASPVQRPPAARLCPAPPDRGDSRATSSFANTCDRRAAPGWQRSPNRWDRRRPRTRGRRR
jgi:hypothetical protein